TAPITVSIALRFMPRPFAASERSRDPSSWMPCSLGTTSVGDPRLVIVAGLRAVAAFEHMSRRAIGLHGSGQVRGVFLLPLALRLVARRRCGLAAMQPAMPFRRHLRRFRLAIVNDPTPLPAM